MPPRSQIAVLDGPPPEIPDRPNPFELPSSNDNPVSMEDGVMKIEHEDGSVTIDLSPKPEPSGEQNGNAHSANLALKMDDSELENIASGLLEGISSDDTSRKDWIETRARGISLLGLVLKPPKADVSTGGSGIEGMSSIDHPIILEATTNFQATARAELLPAAGPVKVRNDTPPQPEQELQQTSAIEDLKRSLVHSDQLATALERDMNHFLTAIATEYVPDTDRMLFHVGFGGDGFKKVYNCPLRRRPVSESVDAEDLIVSNAATDLKNCGRVTHRIRMRQAVLKRMQILGAYRDIDLNPPPPPQPNAVDQKKAELIGIKDTYKRPEDRDYELYETYCELDLDEFAPKKFKGKGLPLPYRVTIEKDSRKVLDVRRNWDEDDPECLPKQFFVQFPFVRGLGFYGLGFIHLLGNTALTLTATWREILDAGMYASFPGFIYNKQLGRQLTNQFRVPPGGGIPLDLGPQQKVQDAVMPIPYREPGANFTAFVTHVEEVGQRLASTANIQVGEGKQDAPVGTTLALIEQATKILDSAHKRLHAAQAEEFQLLKDRFREDPEAFWRFNKTPTMKWEKQQFLDALDNYNLVPVADPNNPTSLHRIAKAATLKELQKATPSLYDNMAVDMRIMNIVGIDPQGLFLPKEAPPPPDPRFEAIKEKAQASQTQAQLQYHEQVLRHQTTAMQIQGRAQDRISREKIESLKLELEKLKLYQASVIHDKTAFADAKAREAELQADLIRMQGEQRRDTAKMLIDVRSKREKTASEIMMQRIKHQAEMRRDEEKHRVSLMHEHQAGQTKVAHERRASETKLEHDRQANEAKLEHTKELGKAKVEVTKAMAKAKPKPKAKKD
jgi:hypothetical protein